MSSFEEIVKQKCRPGAILNTSVITNKIYTLKIQAYQSNYENGKFLYWYVECDIPCTEINSHNHPLKYIGNNLDKTWGIIADNDLVRLILQYLTLSDKELNKKCGHVDQMEYRASLIRALDQLWD